MSINNNIIRHQWVRLIAGAAGVLTGLLPFITAAQSAADPTGADATETIAEIIVTAQKRAENLQDVPSSIAAFTGAALTEQRVLVASDFGQIAPNLVVQQTIGDSTPIFALRGVSMSDYSLNQSPPVATYFDEVYKGNIALLGVGLFDIERLEVLRGPQGTLYGKNTTGGAVNIISRPPEFSPEQSLTVGYGNFNRVDTEGVVQRELAPNLAVRAAFTFARADGWFRNTLPGYPDLNSVHQWGARVSFLYKPLEPLSFTLRLSTSLQNPTNYGIYAQPGPLGIGNGVYDAFYGTGANTLHDDFRVGLGPREISTDYAGKRSNRTLAAQLTSQWDLSSELAVTGVSAWQKASLFFPEVSDGGRPRALDIDERDAVQEISQDLRLSSAFSGPFNFIVGFYFDRESVFNATADKFYTDLDVNADGVFNAKDCAAGISLGFLGCQVVNRFDQRKESEAGYTDLRYQLDSILTLRGGLRFTRDTGDLTNFKSGAYGIDNVLVQNLIPGPSPVSGLSQGCHTSSADTVDCGFSDRRWTGAIGIDAKLAEGTLLYGNVRRGYRASAFNAQAFFQPVEVGVARPETITAYELGVKTRFLNNRVQLNSSVFYYQYHDQQFLNTDPISLAQQLLNLPKSRIYGGEMELESRITSRLDLRLGVGALSTRVQEGAIQGQSIVGNRLTTAPDANVTTALNWRAYQGPTGSLAFNLSGSYYARQFFDAMNRLSQGSYGVFNSNISYHSAGDRWSASVWAKNLTDKLYYTSRIDVSGFGLIYNHVSDPRTFGVSVTYRK